MDVLANAAIFVYSEYKPGNWGKRQDYARELPLADIRAKTSNILKKHDGATSQAVSLRADSKICLLPDCEDGKMR